MNGRTTTGVDSRETMLRQRETAFLRDQIALTAVSLFVQVIIGCCLYLNDHVSTPGYLCVLLLAAPLALFYGLAHSLQRRSPAGQGPLPACLGRRGGRAGAVLLALCCLTDAQLASFSLCAVMSEILPDVSSLWVAFSTLLLTAFAIGGHDVYALPRLARLLRWVLVLFLLWPMLAALPQGNVGHLFPFLGQGAGSVAMGAGWMAGCVSHAVFPWVLPKRETEGILMREIKGFGTLACAVLLGALFSLAAAFLLPFYALSRPESLGWRLMLFGTLSPSLIGWSLNVWGILFFLLFGISAGVTRAAGLISWTAGKEANSPFLMTLLLFLQLPLAALQTDGAENLLMFLAPWRAAAVLLVLLCMLAGYSLKRRKARKA